MSMISPDVHPLFTEEIVKALKEKNLCTIIGFVDYDTQKIIQTTRLTFKEILDIKKFLLKKYSGTVRNGFHYYRNVLSNSAIIPTGLKNVDTMLEGGLISGNIYELCGLPASGKTQFVLNLCKNVVLNMQQKLYFLDTKNDFQAKKMKKILQGYNKEKTVDQALKNILVKKTLTKFDLINSLYEIKKDILDNRLKLRIIIIDSLAPLFLTSSDTCENNFFLNQMVNIMRYISVERHVVFFVTNLITSWTDWNLKNIQDPTQKIACGKYWLTVPNTRIKIEKEGEICHLSVLNSDFLSDFSKTAKIGITDDGVVDI